MRDSPESRDKLSDHSKTNYKQMKYLLVCITLVFASISMNAHSQTKIKHVAIYDKDIKASGEFYENIVGLKEIDEPF